MKRLAVECREYGEIVFWGDDVNRGHDFLIRSNCGRHDPDLLVFLDSRGVGKAVAGSLAQKIVEHVQHKKRYLLVCRPLELTTWATLGNFLKLNEVAFPEILSNVGFVDFTPKKESVLCDAVRQVEAFAGPGVASSRFVENYPASDGTSIPLYSMAYGQAYAEAIRVALGEARTLILNTPLVSPTIRLNRQRPPSFFSMLERSNEFNRSFANVRVLDFGDFDERHTYDGVHYTDFGNETIFERLGRLI